MENPYLWKKNHTTILSFKDIIINNRENGYKIIDQMDNSDLSQNSGFLKFINQKYLLRPEIIENLIQKIIYIKFIS